jgi:hypothetical protein
MLKENKEKTQGRKRVEKKRKDGEFVKNHSVSEKYL